MEQPTLLTFLQSEAGLSPDQAARALSLISEYAKERFPVLEGTIESLVCRETGKAQPASTGDPFSIS